MAAITVTTGIPASPRSHVPRSTTRRLPTTAPGRRPSVATGRSLGARSAAAGVAGVRPVTRATYWRRRLFVAVLVMGLVLVMAQAGAALGGSSLASSERRPTPAAADGQTPVGRVAVRQESAGGQEFAVRQVVVQPGDSLWSVARRLAPGSDPRPVVDALTLARHGAPLLPGETVEWGG